MYGSASPAERHQVHGALADVIDHGVDPAHRAWHRAQAAAGPDEEVATELERCAARAQALGGFAAGGAFLQRSVELTLDPMLRTRRALAAAQANFEAAAPDAASELLAAAEMGQLDEVQRARLERLRAQIAFARTGDANTPGLSIGPGGPALLLDAAKRLALFDRELTRETYLEAITGAMLVSADTGPSRVRAVAEAARRAPPRPQPPRPVDLLLDGLVARFTQPYDTAVLPLKEALRALVRSDGRADNDPRWIWFACPVAPEPIALGLWDDETWYQLATRAVTLARDTGALVVLPKALLYRACMLVYSGEFTSASALIQGAYSITEATGNAPPLIYPKLMLAAWRGEEAAAHAVIEAGIQDATARGLGRAIRFANYTTAILCNGLGRYQEALTAAQRACGHDDLGVLAWALIELVEAGARSERRDVAADALHRLQERTRASGSDWALGIEAHARALLSEGTVAEHLYQEAIARLAHTRIRVELARAQLHYGEWLRRERRRADPRIHLRDAYNAFASVGAEAFAGRARRELLATGQKVHKRRDAARAGLTDQEEQIARLASQGFTNREIGGQLFISERTAEWHLSQIFHETASQSESQVMVV